MQTPSNTGPNYVQDAVKSLLDAGFDARVKANNDRITIVVKVPEGDQRIEWSPAVGRKDQASDEGGFPAPDTLAPSGFLFTRLEGKLHLTSDLVEDEEAAKSFAACFLTPAGSEGRINGPLAAFRQRAGERTRRTAP